MALSEVSDNKVRMPLTWDVLYIVSYVQRNIQSIRQRGFLFSLLMFLPIENPLFSFPFQDFLFPQSLQPSYKLTHTQPHPSPPVDDGRPLFPPVRHLSFHSPVTTRPDNHLKTAEAGKQLHMPPVNPAAVQAVPSADSLWKLQPAEPPAGPGIQLHAALRNPQR